MAGDIGGTKTRLGVFEVDGNGCRELEERSFPSRNHAGLDEIVVDHFGSEGCSCRAACFGIAGAVTGSRVQVTNLPWVVDAEELEVRTGIPSVALINDLEATGWGVPALDEKQFAVLNRGREGAA